MIPPSNLIIIFALVSDVSIPRLFLAGILPGIALGLMLMVVVFVISLKIIMAELMLSFNLDLCFVHCGMVNGQCLLQ